MNRHVPVLLEQTLQAIEPLLGNRPQTYFADVTFGGGGHTGAILRRFPFCHVLACDKDQTAFEKAKSAFASELADDRLRFFHGNFKELPDNPWSPPETSAGWDGILADLGYSSNQLEDSDYGMSFQTDGPLDMRLSRPPEGLSAWDILNTASAEQLTNLLKSYGEMSGAHRLAPQIQEAISKGDITDSTLSLARWMEKKFPRHGSGSIHPATLVFQALRIATNDELRSLDHLLRNAILKLRPGGRLLVITFHSLEDRIVKHVCGQSQSMKVVSRKPFTADDAEIRQNPRSRSAKLRVYQKI